MYATHSISTFAPIGNVDTPTVDLAGNSWFSKKDEKASLTWLKWLKSVTKIVIFTIFDLLLPPELKIASKLLRDWVVSSLMLPEISFLVFGSIAIAFVLITDKVIGDELTVGDYSALIGMFYMLSASAAGLGLYWVELQKNIAAVRRVFFFIDYTSEYGHDDNRMDRIQNEIKIRDVNFWMC